MVFIPNLGPKKTGTISGMYDQQKHTRYLSSYSPNDFYWGIGIENETYFQFTVKSEKTTLTIYGNHKPERYSVDYFSGYNPEYKLLLKSIFPPTQRTYNIPIYLNAHTLIKTDISGNHATTYEKLPRPNPRFKGKTVHEVLCEANPQFFKDRYKINYIFDGDTIEFMTQKFYNTTVGEVMKELISEKHRFLVEINKVFKKANIFKQYGQLMYPVRNEPFVSFLTNLNNIATFNNGTYHLNFTIPTQLDSNSQPANMAQFVSKHKAAIRYIQYLEPLIVSLYGTPDPFAAVSSKFSRASQRCAASRYIGLGTYDTDIMLTGKILLIPVEELTVSKHDFWWYTIFHKTSNYNRLPKIGCDINFNKHGAHGIEIRFLDWFPENRLQQLMETMVHVLDYSLIHGIPDNPIHSPLWNQIVVKCLQSGPATMLNDEEYCLYVSMFDIPMTKKRLLSDVYELIERRVRTVRGPCAQLMLRRPSCFGL